MPHIEIGLVFQIFQFRCVLECCKRYLGDKSRSSWLQLVEQNEKKYFFSETLQTLQVNFSQRKACFPLTSPFTEAASTRAAAHWSPAVLHWSFCVFWCTGPECDGISLLRQKRQARSPPSGHWPLHLDEGNCMCNHNGMLLGVQAQLCSECPDQAGRNFQVRSWDRSARRWEKRRGPGASATLKTCQPQWTRTTMKWASSLSSSEWKLWYLSLLFMPSIRSN